MEDHKDLFKQQVNDSLSGYESAPPEFVWENIAASRSSRRRIALFWMAAKVAAVLLPLALLTFFALNQGKRPRQEFAEKKASSVMPPAPADSGETGSRNSAPFNEKSESFSSAGTVYASVHATPKNAITHDKFFNLNIYQSIPEQQDSTDKFEPAGVNAGSFDQLQAENHAEAASGSEKESAADVAIIALDKPSGEIEVIKPAQGSNWNLALGYSTLAINQQSSQQYALTAATSNFQQDVLTGEVAYETQYFDDVVSTTHEIPLSIGILISHRLSERWFLETGIVYTRLGYMLATSEISNNYTHYRNRIYYLGVPVGVRFEFIQRKKVKFYGSMAFIPEKGISATSTTDHFSQGVLAYSDYNRAGVRGMQLSANPAFGISGSISKTLSLFGQAGLQWYMLNGSQPYNLRSAHLLWPSATAGIRIELGNNK